MSKFISTSFLSQGDGLEFTEVKTDPKELPIKLDEKKISFMTLQEQIFEQQRFEQAARDEVTKVERKNVSKTTIFDKQNPLQEETIFKQEIFNEEDFDYFQYYGQLKEIEERNNRIEKQEIHQFKQERAKLLLNDKPQIIVAKDNNKEKMKTSFNCIKIQVKKPQPQEEKKERKEESNEINDQNEPAPTKKVKVNLLKDLEGSSDDE